MWFKKISWILICASKIVNITLKIRTFLLFYVPLQQIKENIYLHRTVPVVSAIAQVALGSVQGYHGLVLASGLYGASLGGALYSLKMLALERLRARHFARSWALVQAAEALPILLGVPLTGKLKVSPKNKINIYSMVNYIKARLHIV